MNHLVPVQTWLPRDVAMAVKNHCQKSAMRTSEFIRSLVVEAYEEGLEDNRIERHLRRIDSDLNFITVAVDALVSGHPEKDLRDRVMNSFAQREALRRKPRNSVGGEVQ